MPTIVSPDGVTLAYEQSKGSAPAVLFLGGYRSDMQGTKALALEAYCRQRGIGFTRFDYRAHGQSSGDFLAATLTDWRNDALYILDNVTQGKQILVGSSMGGHLMLLLALARPERVCGLMGIAAAPDFTEKLMWARADEAARCTLQEEGVLYLPSEYSDEPYAITLKLIEDGRKHLLLDAPIPIDVPVTLLHGMRDVDVPWQFSQMLAEKLTSPHVDLLLRKQADHRFSREEDIAVLLNMVDRMMHHCKERL